MTTDLRIGSLNLRAMPNPDREQIHQLAGIVSDRECDVVLLQECLTPWLDVVCKATAMNGIHSHTLPPQSDPREFSPDGCAIAFGESIEVNKSWRIPPERFMPEAVQERIYEAQPPGFEPMPERLALRYSGRSALAEIAVEG